MKNYIKLFCLSAMLFLLNGLADANWIGSESDMKFTPHLPNGKAGTQHLPNGKAGTQQTQHTPHSKSDSLPAGVTKEFLNSLTDEKGQKIIHNEDPEGDAMQERFFTGFAASDQFGYSISSAGDVNGDGYDDIVIGALFNDAGGTNAGRAYIYYGGIIVNSGVDVILTGLAASDQFGISVSSAGDVNGDGFGDVIIGANNNDAGGSNAGRAYIYFGGSSMNNVADVLLTGAAISDNFGYSVSSAGDMNGDGYSDVIVGAQLNDAGGNAAGRAYVYHGGSSMNSVADLTITGAAANDNFGNAVSLAGDMNGDGYGDIIVGANGNDAGGSSAGRAYVYFGGSIPDSIVDVTMTGAAASDNFGIYLSSAGDVNGDGFSDVIVSAYFNDAGGSNAGSAYIYFGGIIPNNTADVIFTGAVAGDQLGISVSSAGDINGDGYSDVIAGANLNDAGGTSAGRAYIYLGGLNMDNTADVVLTGKTTFDQFGWSVSTAGDMNGDGYSDMIVGAILNDAGGSSAGRAYIYLNSMTGTDIADEFFTGAAVNDGLGYSVSSAGDVNGDGFADLIIGAPYNSAGGSNAGRVYIYFGGIIQDNVADMIITGAAAIDLFGYSVSSAGDVNADGYADVIVGAIYNDAGGSNAGRAYIYFGGSLPDTLADVIMTGEAASDDFGNSVSSAGDVNGDGYSDVIVGALHNSSGGSNAGRVYIYFGGSAMNNLADITMTGEAAQDLFGNSVSSAGDVNGDGYSDVIAGAYGYSSFTGRSYVYFGGTSMNNSADLAMTGEASGDSFGYSVSSAGDVNGDGYCDVICGADLNNAGGSSAGRAYIYFGGSSMNNLVDVTMTGETTNDYFGHSVSLAGDVNSDGYGDVIVGALFNNGGGSDAGRAYIYFGGSDMNNVADVTMTGSAVGDVLGNSVSSAGDVNNDGYSDVIVGANGSDAGGSNAGRAYLYLSSAPSVKPILNLVKDVPNDQGGQVYLKWARSGYDVQGINKIVSYSVLRSFPPVNGNFSWQTVAEVSAEQIPFYSFVDHTPVDSTANNSGTFFYRIKAKTSSISEYWYSGILSGRSLDNIPPLMVSPFSAVSESSNIRLTWNKNTEPDLYNYILYRSISPTIDPETETPYATVTDSTYLDTTPLSGAYYYFIVAQDVHNNKSPV
ncbi:MAG: FG-GAP-like repeat-containing protein, partial [Ignavibacteria bacterium]